jgi:ubiquinone/menaquinone biosynthesis C-methylase UbiE
MVPRVFAVWPRDLLETVAAPGMRALDVGCGTGIVARPTADRVAPSSSVVGLDANAAMLTVARAKNDAGTVQTGKKRSISKITNAQQAQMVSIK